jgi:hypothetical protein
MKYRYLTESDTWKRGDQWRGGQGDRWLPCEPSFYGSQVHNIWRYDARRPIREVSRKPAHNSASRKRVHSRRG